MKSSQVTVNWLTNSFIDLELSVIYHALWCDVEEQYVWISAFAQWMWIQFLQHLKYASYALRNHSEWTEKTPALMELPA